MRLFMIFQLLPIVAFHVAELAQKNRSCDVPFLGPLFGPRLKERIILRRLLLRFWWHPRFIVVVVISPAARTRHSYASLRYCLRYATI